MQVNLSASTDVLVKKDPFSFVLFCFLLPKPVKLMMLVTRRVISILIILLLPLQP